MIFLRKISSTNNRRGSFLLEALLAVLILSVGLVGLIRGLLSSLNAAGQAEAYANAIVAAENALPDVIRLNGQKAASSVTLETDSKNLTAQIKISAPPNVDIPETLQEAWIKIQWPGVVKQKEIHAVTLVLGPSDEKK